MEQSITSMIEFAFGGSSMNAIIESMGSILTSATVQEKFTEIFELVMLPLGAYLMIIYFLKGMGTTVISGEITPEKMGKIFIKLAVSYYAIKLSADILWKLVDVGEAVLQSFQGVATIKADGTGIAADILAIAKKDTNNFKDWGGSLMLWFQLAIPYLVIWLITIYVRFMIMSREIEMLIRIMWAPVALSNIYEGDASGAVKYLKKFAALSIQVVVMVSILYLSGLISGEIVEGMMKGLSAGTFAGETMKYVTINIVTAGLIGKSVSLSEEIVGLR